MIFQRRTAISSLATWPFVLTAQPFLRRKYLAWEISFTYKFYVQHYDDQWNLLFTTPNLTHRILQKYLFDESKHEINFNMSNFGKVEHVKITFKCEEEGFDNPSANARSGPTALTPKGEGN